MKFGYTIIYVNSVEEVLEFYKNAFNLNTKFIHESKDYGELDTGETTLAFASHALGESNLGNEYIKSDINQKALGMELALVTNNVEEAFENAVTAGAIPLKKPTLKPWGQTVGYVRAIDGSIIELCSPVSG